jgi:hypothetical protein
MDFNGDFVQFFGSNPSGHPLTVIVNGLVNSLYFRYVYYMLNPAHEVKSFKSKVHLLTYGDDNVFGVCISAPWFNHTSIAAALLESGITYTMADKEAESVPYLHIRDVTFLKRSWRFDSDVGAYLAPIDHESLERSLMCGLGPSLFPFKNRQFLFLLMFVENTSFTGRKPSMRNAKCYVIWWSY